MLPTGRGLPGARGARRGCQLRHEAAANRRKRAPCTGVAASAPPKSISALTEGCCCSHPCEETNSSSSPRGSGGAGQGPSPGPSPQRLAAGQSPAHGAGPGGTGTPVWGRHWAVLGPRPVLSHGGGAGPGSGTSGADSSLAAACS